jgi:hypothetical protein
MITLTVAQRLGSGRLPIPLIETYQHRLAASRGGSLLNDTRMNAQTVVGDELYQPLVYAFWTYRETMNYRLTDNRLVEDPENRRVVELVNILVPINEQKPILAFGSAKRTTDALQAMKQALESAGGQIDYRLTR